MEKNNDSVLIKILTKKELEKIPPDISKKLQTHFTEKFEEFLTSKALCETAKSNIDKLKEDLEKKNGELSEKLEDYEAKFKASQQSVEELRNELETSKAEIHKLNELVRKYETETSEYRKERNDAIDERDSLHKMVERRNIEVERLQSDCLTLEKQLQSSITAKCEALAKVDEIQSKEVSLEYKEKRMEQEKFLLNNTIKTLNEDLNRNVNELTTIRRDHTLRLLTLETKLNEKTEEIKIANNTIVHLTETNDSLTAKAEDLAAKLLSHSDEVTKMMDNYKKELNAKTKLAELYKEASDDNKNQIDELSATVTELKKLLDDFTENYGELETKMKSKSLDHEHEIEEKDKQINSLKDELKNANDLLKMAQDENLDNVIEHLAPTAAASSRLIKSGMSLTEIYSLYVKSTEELQVVKKENSRLNLQIRSILNELEEKAPLIRKQAIDHQNLIENNEMLSQQMENFLQERIKSRGELEEINAKLSFYERENKKLRTAQSDLSRQVCFLLKEIEQIRGGCSSEVDQSISSDMSADEVITKKLVTFSDIQELQDNNQKLLLVVRDLSSKLEELEQVQINMQQENYETKLETFAKRVKDMENSQEYQAKMLTSTLEQKERYKKLYQECCKMLGKSNFSNIQMNGDDFNMEEDTPLASTSSMSSNKSESDKDKKTNDLEDKIKELTNNLKTLKEEYENYRKEKLTNEKMTNEQFDSMRNEVRELTSTNCRLLSAAEYSAEQLKILQKNAATYKKQITALEERNKNYENTIVKHEQTLMHVKDEALSAQTKLARYEVMVDNFKQEIRIARDSESRLQMEREVLHRERQSQNLLLNNLEMIKASFERSETEGRMRMESRLDETTRECSALRRRLQEEQDRFRELTTHLERQTESAKQKMEDEKTLADKFRIELKVAREELEAKSKQIDQLSHKLQESLTPTLNDNPITQANKKAKDIELKYEQTKADLENLEKELVTCREHVKQYCTMAQSSEKEMKEMYEKFTEDKQKQDVELIRLRKVEAESKSRIGELETEISLQITGAQLNTGDVNSKLHKANLELQETLQKLSENNRELRELRSQNTSLSASLQQAEQKYANEMIMHSSDIQAMSKMKDEYNRIHEDINKLKSDRDEAVENLQMAKKGWEETEKLLKTERIELEERITQLDAQNSALHDQIQTLSTKLSISSAVGAENNKESNPNESMDIENSSLVNRSINEDEVKSADQLLQIIKYIRKEKDIAVAKVDILRTETARLLSEHSVLQSKLDEAVNALANERSKTDVGVATASKHSELLRKIETLNAVTDSNRILRDERDNLSQKVQELTDRVTKCEDELYPIQEKNRELSAKSEATAAENASLRIEATRWRQRANLLVERSNKASPEDFKRLQAEREGLAKMLTTEKENLKKATDELNSIKADKTKLENDLQNLSKQLSSSADDNKKYLDEINTMRQSNTRMSNEIMELKNALIKKEDELKKVTEDLTSKDAQLMDAKNKEIQIRKIAKRYKDSFFELKKQEEEKENERNEDGNAGESSTKAEAEKLLQEKINELTTQIQNAQENIIKLTEENTALKSNIERDEKNKQLLKDAKLRILSLTESKNSLIREIANAKVHIQSIEQNRDEHDLLMNGLKSQYETRISRLESSQNEQEKEKQEVIARLSRENENLLVRINQLNRQHLQQGTKPTTSSNTTEKTTDNPRTANVKPMSGPGSQQSATVTPWRGSETPLASIRPMSVQNSRTVAVLPTSQTSNLASVQGSSSGSVTALVPPQQVHTTGNSNSGEAMSSSPTSSHTDYMPATSSAAVVVAAVPPLGSASTTAESSQEAESIQTQNNESSISQLMVVGGQQQAVALVSPRVEGTQQNIIPPQLVETPEQNQAPPSSSTPVTISSSHNQASSSNTVTTTQAGHKRPRDVEGDSSTGNSEESDKQQHSKRARAQTGETFQGVSESGLEVEYQVPTSSQRDQEDDVIVVDSEEDDDGNAEADDGPFEDDNGDGYDMEIFEHEPDMQNYDEGEGPDIDEDNVQSDNNEVEVDDSSEVPNQSGSSVSRGHVAPDGGSGNAVVGQSSSSEVPVASAQNQAEIQQIQTISSGSEIAGSSTPGPSASSQGWRQNSPHIRGQQQASHLMLIQDGYEESVDDSIVPCTPTLYAPRRTDGFSEAVSSPHSQVPLAARFTFSEPRSLAGQSSAVVPSDRVDDSQAETNEAEDAGNTSTSTNAGQKVESAMGSTTIEQTSSTADTPDDEDEPVAGPSHSEGSVPEITITIAGVEDDDMANDDENATTSDVPEDDRDKDMGEGSEVEDGEGTDGVSSEGEKTPGVMVEEGREAEATQTPSSNTRSRSTRGSSSQRRGSRQQSQRGGRPTPIIWQDSSPRGSGSRNMPMNHRNLDSGSPSRMQYQNQRSQRARRMRRPSGPNFGNNMRY